MKFWKWSQWYPYRTEFITITREGCLIPRDGWVIECKFFEYHIDPNYSLTIVDKKHEIELFKRNHPEIVDIYDQLVKDTNDRIYQLPSSLYKV